MKYYSIFYFALLSCMYQFCSCNNQKNTDNTDGANEPLFTLLKTTETNIGFQNELTEALNTNILMYEYFYNGGGVAAGDLNNDGLPDLYFTSNMGDNKLYLNRGNMKFEDITDISGAGGRYGPWKTGVNIADINGDGKLDIYLCYSGALPPEKRANQLFINTGNDSRGIPVFQESAEAYGLASTAFSNQSYFFDYDKDGDLDMLLLNHNPKNLPILNEASTAAMFKVDNPEKGLRLYKQTNGKFEDITIQAGINGSELSYGLGLGISDFNDDGWPDFYVSNDYTVPDCFYINNKNGTFTNELANCIAHTSQFSMGNDVADINNDGLCDIYTLDMLPENNHRQKLLLTPDNYSKFNLNVKSGFYYQYMRNMLQLNNGNGTFSEIGQVAGISNTDWSWAALFGDYDNDGWKDLFVTNGYKRDYTNLDFINYMNDYVEKKGRLQREDVMGIIQQMPSSNVINYVFQNKHGNEFQNRSHDWGITQPSNSNGALYADLDNDGDLDLVVNNVNQPAFIYRNESQKLNTNHFLQVHLIGDGRNTQGLGAKLKIFYNDQIQTLEQYPARGYLSAVSSELHFGLGAAQKADSLIITWNSGKIQKLYNIKANQLLNLTEKDAVDAAPLFVKPVKKWFTEIPSSIKFRSPDTIVNDFNRQPLLISQFSHNGPCMFKYDLNNDGLDDIIIGGAAGQATGIYMQQKNGDFSIKKTAAFEKDKAYEAAAIAVLDANGDGNPDIYIASGGYYDFSESDSLLDDRLYINDGKGNFFRSNVLPKINGSKSCVKIQDINSDGVPDIFVGGRVVPGRYPEPPKSFILINDGKGNFSDQTEKICPALSSLGMITDAAWIDLDLDKKNELVIVGEWMPVTVFKLENGKLINHSNEYFDKTYSGWWNTISTGDFNSDNKPDLLIGNMGLNTQFKATEKEPLEMYYKDFDNNGSIDPIFSFYIQHKRYPYITRDELVSQLPFLRKRFADFKSYADITMEELFKNDELKQAKHLTANDMSTICFLSSATGKFKVSELPQQVQYSPVYSITQMDFNSDGKTDVLLCGNNSRTKIRLGKFDANYGVLLAGDGKGGFNYVNQSASGFNIWGDVRSCLQINDKVYFGVNSKNLIVYNLSKQKK